MPCSSMSAWMGGSDRKGLGGGLARGQRVVTLEVVHLAGRRVADSGVLVLADLHGAVFDVLGAVVPGLDRGRVVLGRLLLGLGLLALDLAFGALDRLLRDRLGLVL